MDSLAFDTYSAYSDASTPRTPSPHEMLQFHKIYKPDFIDYKGSLLNELYEHDIPPEYQHHHHQHSQDFHSPDIISTWRPHDYPIMRRATFPCVRHDQPYPSQFQHHQPLYNQPHHIDGPHPITSSSSPHSSYHDFDDSANIKLEDPMATQQSNFYRSPHSSCHQIPISYIPPHNNLPVQHTDDAASKETQYLRRRCFNCHTTEPPSWRRSTLNPGKIVCNKCGLYERTHLRPRPLRFDELRTGGKSRKLPKSSPKQSKIAMIKKEPRDCGIDQRSSASSGSSIHSGSGTSDWDDDGSLYSAGSAPPTSFNSPNVHNYPLSRDDSLSPLQDGTAIRLPNNPLSDVASMHHPTAPLLSQPILRSRSHTSPGSYYSPPSLSDVNPLPQPQDYFSHSQNGVPTEGLLWVEPTEHSRSESVSSPTGSS